MSSTRADGKLPALSLGLVKKSRCSLLTDAMETPETQETRLTCGELGPTESYRIAGKVAEE